MAVGIGLVRVNVGLGVLVITHFEIFVTLVQRILGELSVSRPSLP